MAISLKRQHQLTRAERLQQDIIRLVRVMSIIKQDGCPLDEAVNLSFTGERNSYAAPDRICVALDLALPNWCKQLWYNQHGKFATHTTFPSWEWFSNLDCVDLDDIQEILQGAIERLSDPAWMG